MLRVRKRHSGPMMSNGRIDAAMSAKGLFQVEPVEWAASLHAGRPVSFHGREFPSPCGNYDT